MPSYGYGPYGQQQYGNGYYNNPAPQQYQPYPNYSQPMAVYPLTYTNGLIGAKAFPLQQPNSTVYLIDSDTNDILYKKDADNQGRCALKAYKLIETPLDQIGMPMQPQQSQSTQMNFATKEDIEILQKSLKEIMMALKGNTGNEQSDTSINSVAPNGQ